MSKANYIKEIKKTGFVLEHNIVTSLQNKGWTTINNKYYEDDLLNTVREIDIVAYKVNLIDNTYIYTTLIISCKKNEDNAWVMLSRDLNENDPNSNWWPLHLWSDDTVLQNEFNSMSDSKVYYDLLQKHIQSDYFGLPSSDIFAFQEMSKKTGRPQNDKAIFNSLTGLMKALSYEVSVRKTKKEFNSLYQFNLISIIDSDLVQLHMKGDNIKESEVNNIQLISQYIINRKNNFFKIRIINSKSIEELIEKHDLLHSFNCSYFEKRKSEFLKNSIFDSNKIDLLKNDFYNGIKNVLEKEIGHSLNLETTKKRLRIIYESSKKSTRIFISEDQNICNVLNESETINEKIKKELMKVFRYDGDFFFSINDLPF